MDTLKNSISEIWESQENQIYDIIEASENEPSEVDGKYILAKVRGPAFFPETTSGNKVFYPQEAWESAISEPDFIRRLDSRLVYGTIGHNIELTDDTIREGKHSHIVTKVWIDEDTNIGMAEYLILNTPPGQVLNTLLRAKSRLRVSTKCSGRFKNDTSRSNAKIVDPTTFELERIDFVIDPGYVNALPELIESLNVSSNPTKDLKMDNNDKAISILESRVKELTTEKGISEAKVAELVAELTSIKESHAAQTALLESYKAIGTAAAIHEAYAELTQYQRIGSAQEIHEALEQGEDTLDQLAGTVAVLTGELQDKEDGPKVDDYQDLGSPEEVKNALDQALDIANELQAYRDLGSPEELAAVVTNAAEMTTALEAQEKDSMCGKYGITPDVLENLLSRGFSLEEADDTLAKIKGVPAPAPANAPVETTPDDIAPPVETTPADIAPTPDGPTPDTPPPSDSEDDEKNKEDKVNESLSSRLMRQASRKTVKTQVNESLVAKSSSLAARLLARK